MTERWREELDVAIEAAWAAGRITLRWFQGGVEAERKADGSPVTVADREAEAVLREILRGRFPADGIVGEEGGEEPAPEPGAEASDGARAEATSESGGSRRRWILDPIDGTRSFVRGVPLYGVMVALESDGEAVLGVLHFPALGETIAAARGLGCRWNGRACSVSATARLEDALVVTSGDAGPDDPRAATLDTLRPRVDTFRTWGDCYGYALVATGRADAMLDPVLNLWDAAAVRPIIEEAGGLFTDWYGTPSHTSGHAIATNAPLARPIREAVS